MAFLSSSKWIWAFSLISIVQAALILILEIYIFVTFHNDLTPSAKKESNDEANTIPVFLALYIFAFIYQLVLVWDALRLKNTIQVIGLVGLNIGLLIYGAVQVDQLHDAVRDLQTKGELIPTQWDATNRILIAIPCILAFFTIALAFAAYKLYNEFAWTIYKHISADLRMKRRYLTYQIYIALLKFDFFFTLGFTIQFVVIVRGRYIGNTPIEQYLTAAAIPVTVIIMLAAFWFTRRENMPGTIAVIALYFGGLTYFFFKLIRMYDPDFEQPYLTARKELTTFAVLTIGLLISTIIVACMCAHNYGKGLQPYIRSSKGTSSKPENQRVPIGSVEHGEPNSYNAAAYNMTEEPYNQKPATGRMEID